MESGIKIGYWDTGVGSGSRGWAMRIVGTVLQVLTDGQGEDKDHRSVLTGAF